MSETAIDYERPPGLLKTAFVKTFRFEDRSRGKRIDSGYAWSRETFNNLPDDQALVLLNKPPTRIERVERVTPAVGVLKGPSGHWQYTPWAPTPLYSKEAAGTDRMVLAEVVSPLGYNIVANCTLPHKFRFMAGLNYLRLLGELLAYSDDVPDPNKHLVRLLAEDRPAKGKASVAGDTVLRALRAQKFEEQRKLPEYGQRSWVKG